MSVPSLKMCQPDVETAAARKFRKSFDEIQFINVDNIVSYDNDGQISFFLQENFTGKGIYRVMGIAKLFDSDGASKCYNLECSIDVDDLNGEPQINFINPISLKKR